MNIPGILEEALRAHNVIPFVGAGVSMEVRDRETGARLFPSWKKLLTQAAQYLEDQKKAAYANLVRSLLELDRPEEYLEAARRARDGLGPAWSRFLKEQLDISYDRSGIDSLRLARAIWELGSRLLITTNYDRVLHWACPQRDDLHTWEIEAPAEQVALLRGGLQYPTVWHLHGYIDNTTNLILTPDGYSQLYPEARETELRNRYQAALRTLHTLLTTHTFLFIGFSLEDPYFNLQLRSIDKIFQGEAGPHYILVRESEREGIRNLNLPVETVTFPEFGPPLLDLVRHLGSIATAREQMVEAQPPKVIIGDSNAPPSLSYDPRNPYFSVLFHSKGDQFVGRERELRALRLQLTQGRRTTVGQAASLQGLGGLGKTQLAVEYAHRYRSEYANGVFWLNADQDIDAQLIDLAEKARWLAPESEHKMKLDIARRRLKTYSDCLIIFDNLESVEAIADYLPESGVASHILVTSRIDHPHFIPILLDPLTEEQSLKLLFLEAGQEPEKGAEHEAAREIAEAFGGLPLALELAGAYLRHRPVGWQQYLKLLRQNPRAALTDKFFKASATQHGADLYATLKISEEVLTEEPLLKEIMELLAWSGTAPMGLSLLSTLLDVQDSSELTGALGFGVALRLLQMTPSGESYAIHRLVREERRDAFPLSEHHDWVNLICQRVGDWFQERRKDVAYLPNYEAEFDHLRAWQEHALQYAEEHSTRLAWLQGYPPFHRGHYQEAKEWLEKVLILFHNGKGTDKVLEAHLLSNLGAIYFKLGDAKQELEYAKKELAIRQELYGERHPDIAESLASISSAYLHSHNYQNALKYAEQALAIQLELCDEQHLNIAELFDLIGRIYEGLGHHTIALEYLEKALVMAQNLYDGLHPAVASYLNNIGYIYRAQGNHETAKEYYEKSLTILQEFFGEQHPDTVTCLNNIGLAYSGLGDNENAQKYLDKALTLSKELLGEKHPDTVSCAYNLAATLYKLNRRVEAYQLLDRFLRQLPKDHPFYARLKHQSNQFLAQPLRPGFRQPSGKKQGRKKKTKKD